VVENNQVFANGAAHASSDLTFRFLTEISSGQHIVLGAPGSGKTTALGQLVSQLEQTIDPSSILVLTPTRQSATRLRDLLALASKRPTTSPRAQSVTGYAFGRLAESNPQIRLLSGAMQQSILRDLVEKSPNSPWGYDIQTIGLQGFIQELRDLFAVCIENGLNTQWLLQKSQEFNHRGLTIAAELLPAYQEELARRGLVDPSQLILSASQLPAPDYQWILVDDAQDFSKAGLALVQKLAKSANVALFGDPDSSVLGFRAGVVDGFVGEFAAARKHYLEPSSNFSQELSKLASKLPPQLAGPQRPRPSLGQSKVQTALFDNQVSEADWLASEIRQRRMREGLSWGDFAVVARTRTQLDQLASALAAREVPTVTLGTSQPLRDQPMARALLETAHLGLSRGDQNSVIEVLHSPIFGLDSIAIRRLKRQLAQQPDFHEVPSSDLLVAALEVEIEPSTPEFRKLGKLTALIQNVRSLAESSAHELLSAVWSIVDHSALQVLAKGSSEVALSANRSLDSVLELFAAAQRFDANQLGTASDFVVTQLDQAVPEDSLAAKGLRPAVQLTTAAGLSDRSYQVVLLPRLQDGIWPNLRPRSSLLGANSLSGYLNGKVAQPTLPVRSELDDEIRLFYKAIGAARSEVIITAMVSQEEQPSQFFEMLGLSPERIQQAISFDLRRLVGSYRRALASGDQSVAPLLAALALLQVPGAHPAGWQGLLPISTNEPLVVEGEDIRFSPSRLSAFEKCPVHWFIQNFGGDGSGFEASLGTLLHAALEVSTSEVELESFVESNWHTLEFEATWQSSGQKRKALNMVAALGEYLRSAGELVSAEQKFEVKIGRLVIAGKIDRVERDASGGLRVVDLKTGKPPGVQEVTTHRQLAVYQLAVKEQYGEPLAGGRIVAVGDQRLKVLDQPEISGEFEAEILELLKRVEQGAGGNSFVAEIADHCGEDSNCQLLISKVVTNG
jgi:superfamily I DNA/RNA helicase/RecB family exonuclease